MYTMCWAICLHSQQCNISALKWYRIRREQKSGEGFKDFIFYHKNKKNTAFIIELKVNDTPNNAIAKIGEKNYIQTLKDYTGEKLLIRITYDSKDKKHSVKIEKL